MRVGPSPTGNLPLWGTRTNTGMAAGKAALRSSSLRLQQIALALRRFRPPRSRHEEILPPQPAFVDHLQPVLAAPQIVRPRIVRPEAEFAARRLCHLHERRAGQLVTVVQLDR